LSISSKYDVIVAGGGVAGVVAAIAAARNGAKTLLIDKWSYLGGNATAGYVTLSMTYHNMLGEQVVKGIPQEIIDERVKIGDLGILPCPVRPPKMTCSPWNEDIMRYVLSEMLVKSGSEILLHTFVYGAAREQRKVTGVEVVNKSGRQTLRSEVIIDATGDGDVAAAAGATMIKGRRKDGLLLPATLIFKMTHVNLEKTLEYVNQHPDRFGPGRGWSVGTDTKLPIIHINLAGFTDEWLEGKRNGYISPSIDPEHSSMIRINPSRPDEVYVNMTRVMNVDPSDAWSLTNGEIEGMRQAIRCASWLVRYVPGFESSRLVLAPQLGLREGRRIVGEYILTGADIMEGRKFPDVIAKTGIGLDIHAVEEEGGHQFIPTKGGGSCDIPYRVLIPKEVDNLLAAGRCISVDDEALASIRLMPNCMATGQAAGTAAALSAKEGVPPRSLEISKLQKTLSDQGAILWGTS
jgi:hypothetical protein